MWTKTRQMTNEDRNTSPQIQTHDPPGSDTMYRMFDKFYRYDTIITAILLELEPWTRFVTCWAGPLFCHHLSRYIPPQTEEVLTDASIFSSDHHDKACHHLGKNVSQPMI